MTATPVRCAAPACNRVLRSARSVADGIGPRCRARLNAARAVMETALEPLSEAQRKKALALINSGTAVLASRPGTYRVPSSDGTTTYLVTTNYCPCLSRVICYHVGAVRAIEAVRASASFAGRAA